MLYSCIKLFLENTQTLYHTYIYLEFSSETSLNYNNTNCLGVFEIRRTRDRNHCVAIEKQSFELYFLFFLYTSVSNITRNFCFLFFLLFSSSIFFSFGLLWFTDGCFFWFFFDLVSIRLFVVDQKTLLFHDNALCYTDGDKSDMKDVHRQSFNFFLVLFVLDFHTLRLCTKYRLKLWKRFKNMNSTMR